MQNAAIETDGLSKYYGETRGIEDLTFAVDEGEVFGFLGPNGAGKTTAIRTLLGYQSPTSGSATVLGRDVTDPEAMRAARDRIGYLPGDPGLDESVTGRRLLELYRSLRGDERSGELLDSFSPPLDRKVGEYSTGNKQMLAIVIALMHAPDLVVMDEPTSGLDPLKQERLYDLIRRERERGVTFFFSSHILSEVRKVCSRVGIIRDGRLVELEDVETLLHRGGKTVQVRVDDDVTAAEFSFSGVHDLSVSESDGEAGGTLATATQVSFTYTGAYDDLVDHLSEFHVVDLDVEEAPIEEVFMRFYGGEGVDGGDEPDEPDEPDESDVISDA